MQGSDVVQHFVTSKTIKHQILRQAARAVCSVSFILFLLLTFHPAQAYAGEPVILLVANNMSLDDMASAGPNLKSLVNSGAVGFMNTGTRWRQPSIQSYLTIGTGDWWRQPVEGPVCLGAGQMIDGVLASNLYRRETGLRPNSNAVLCIHLAALLQEAAKSPKKNRVGFIGDAFHSAGLKTALAGSGNSGFIAMDGLGIVDMGAVGPSVTQPDEFCPGGLSDDVPAMLGAAAGFGREASFIVVEPGDLNRTEEARAYISDSAYLFNRKKAMQRLDAVAGGLAAQVRSRGGALIICSPRRSTMPGGGVSSLAPVIVWRPKMQPSLLKSASTRLPGLISEVDMAPTILSEAGLDLPIGMLGIPAEPIPAAGAVKHLMQMERMAVRNYALRIPVLASLGALVILVVAAAEFILWKKRGSRRAVALVQLGLLVLLSLPLVLFFSSALTVEGGAAFALYNVLILLVVLVCVRILCLAAGRAGLNLSAPSALLLLTSITVFADAVCGAQILRWSILSCDHITGIRYYGIGNEYMGILVGSALVGVLLLFQNTQRLLALPARQLIFSAVWFILITWVIGFPGVGANVGGLITSVAAFGTALFVLSGTRWHLRQAAVLLLAGLLSVAVFSLVDVLLLGVEASHLGRTVAMVHNYGWGCLIVLAAGKIGMHLAIIKSPQAVYPMLFGIPLVIICAKREILALRTGAGVVHSAGMLSVAAGVSAAFLFNDSGIVPAALILAIYAVAMLYMRIVEVSREINGA